MFSVYSNRSSFGSSAHTHFTKINMDISVPPFICIFIVIQSSFFIIHYSAVYLHNHPESILWIISDILVLIIVTVQFSIIIGHHLPTNEQEYNLLNSFDRFLYRHLPTVRRCAAAAFLSL